MLILRRNTGERILLRNRRVGADITLTVTEVRGNHCRIGIEAPQEWDIVREELLPESEAVKVA